MMHTRITRLLNIRYPVIQGGMAWVADAELAGAVSNAGGLGLIAAASMPGELLRKEIRKVKTLTDRPFGVNIMLLSPYRDEIARLCIEEAVPVVTTGAGNPGQYIAAWKAAGCKVIPVVPTPALALRMERAGADAVVAEGCEAGGHIGEMTTFCLIPQVVDAVSIPVIAAGGIADGRGLAAAVALGADGAQMGSLFLCAAETNIHPAYKQLVLDSGGSDTVVTGRGVGRPVRCIKNRLSKHFLEMEKAGATADEIEELALGSLRRAVQEGDLENGSFMAGQSVGLVRAVKPAAQLLQELVADAEARLGNPLAGREITIG